MAKCCRPQRATTVQVFYAELCPLLRSSFHLSARICYNFLHSFKIVQGLSFFGCPCLQVGLFRVKSRSIGTFFSVYMERKLQKIWNKSSPFIHQGPTGICLHQAFLYAALIFALVCNTFFFPLFCECVLIITIFSVDRSTIIGISYYIVHKSPGRNFNIPGSVLKCREAYQCEACINYIAYQYMGWHLSQSY